MKITAVSLWFTDTDTGEFQQVTSSLSDGGFEIKANTPYYLELIAAPDGEIKAIVRGFEGMTQEQALDWMKAKGWKEVKRDG